MPQKRNICPILLIVSLLVTPSLARCEPTTSSVKITIQTTPELYLNQLTSGDRCSFQVEIQNLGVSVQKGQIVNASDPSEKYSGNFTVQTNFELRKEGGLYYEGQSVGYTMSLNNTQIDNYYTVTIPPIGGTLRYIFTYNLTKGYEILGVRPDENLVLYFRVNVFVQSYSDKDGGYQLHVGNRVQTLKNLYYIIDFVKKEYITGKFLDIRLEISPLKNINSAQVQIGKDYYNNILNNINATINDGNYVYALQLIQNYYQFDQVKLISLLFSNLNSTGQAADAYVRLSTRYTALDANYKQLGTDFYTLLSVNQVQAENISQLEKDLASSKENYLILSITGILLMFAVGFIVGRRPRFF
jgi:hypothetical protein